MNYCTTIPKSKLPAVPRIIVIGDIHGDWAALKSALKVARVTNHHNDWIGRETHVVQVGDLVDRGVRGGSGDEQSERKIIHHLIHLKRLAQRAGGDVHLLLGNHELMNVAGDFRYVSPMGLSDFDGKRQDHFRVGGDIAKTLACNTIAVLQIGNWVFSHAGITTEVSKSWTVEQVNKQFRDYLLGNRIIDSDNPLTDIFWHRRYDNASACPAVHTALSHWNAKKMAVGHTIQNHGINSMCHGGLWKVDVGMSDAFGKCTRNIGNCIEVLEILNDGDEINILRGKKQLNN